MKTAAQLIVHASLRHGAQSFERHFERFGAARERVIAEQKVQSNGPWKFWRFPKAAVLGIERAAEILEGGVERSSIGSSVLGGSRRGNALELSDHFAAGLYYFIVFVLPGGGDALKDGAETGAAVAVVGSEIRSTEKRRAIGGEKNGHRPSAAAGGRLHVGHVNVVDIRTLFAVYFYRNKRPVQNLGDIVVLKRFPFHNVAPMARGITDGEEDGLVFVTGFFESLVAPRIPVHWIVRVLLKVRALLRNQMIGQVALPSF